MPLFNLSLFLLGCLGGLLPDILRLIKARFDKDVLVYLKTFKYWVGLILLAGVGGLVAWLLGSQKVADAIAYGFAAPEIIEKLAASAKPSQSDTRRSTRNASEAAEDKSKFQLLSWWGY